MSNKSTELSAFQQKAQLRLQEMDTEWRRNLFERFRSICREEMMDVMKSLLSTTPNPEALERQLEELKQVSQSTQTALQSTQTALSGCMTQTNEELRTLGQKLETPSPALETLAKETAARQEAISKDMVAKQEEATRTIQEDVKRSAQLSHSTLWKAVVVTAVTCLLLCAGGMMALRWLGGANLVSQREIADREQAIKAKAAAEADLKAAQATNADMQKEVQSLTAKRDALLAEIRQITTTQTTLTANIGIQQQQVAQLQQVQEQFRFKMVKGDNGGVFVEIPPEAKPFQYMDKVFIQVK